MRRLVAEGADVNEDEHRRSKRPSEHTEKRQPMHLNTIVSSGMVTRNANRLTFAGNACKTHDVI